eukprot:TRINITY_DN7542_c0_g1_i1.p1 TRINITY_DN7542_c0_g1~~TRINITY_DN7542_c0_g1_i1.p1  ORF type:complete len:188 (+),score=60.78 TRINITY_DN7542_c0_g1_i1:169-732(+)
MCIRDRYQRRVRGRRFQLWCCLRGAEETMGKKKKGGKKSKKTPEDLAAEEANNKKYADLGLELMALTSTRWCTLHLKCTINVHLFFTVHVPVEQTRLANIYDRIASRHGNSISELTMYKEQVYESNILGPHTSTMAELGFQGTPEGDPATYPEYDILYDFKPRQTKCPLLLSNPYNAYDYGAVFDQE